MADETPASGRPVEHARLLDLAAHEVGAAWSWGGEQINATLLSWEPDHEVPLHVNEEREVLLLVLRGDGMLVADGVEHELVPGGVVVVPRGAGRSIHAGPGGLAYVSAHAARGPLQVTRRRAPRVPPAAS